MILPNVDYHVVELNGPAPLEVIQWTKDSFGNGLDGRWSCRLNKFYFKNKHDHLLFVIKWSSKSLDEA